MEKRKNDLSSWISQQYLNPTTLYRLTLPFLRQKPFPYLELKHFFLEERAQAILQALLQEPFVPQEADLFKFRQTADFSSSQNRVLQEFRTFLSSPEFMLYMNTLTSTTLKPSCIDISGTLYEDTDYLLCHDDQMEGRKVAFFIYLSDLDKNDGGALHLFSSTNGIPTESVATIIPQFNTFSFFLVSEKSFHEVAEVVREVPRIAISGWFHDH